MKFELRETQAMSVEELKRRLLVAGLCYDEVDSGVEGKACLLFDVNEEGKNNSA
jgi:hypothetical protein